MATHPNSAVMYYRKIRQVISDYLALKADKFFDGMVELDEAIQSSHRH